MLMFQLPVSVLAYDNEGCPDHQFLLLKHQKQFLVIQNTKCSLKMINWLKMELLENKESSKFASPFDVLKQTTKLK